MVLVSWLKRVLGNRTIANAHGTIAPPVVALARPQSVAVDNPQLPEDTAASSSRGTAISSRGVLNIVDGLNAVAAYYSFIEVELYEMSLLSVRDRRDFRGEYLNRIAALVAYVNDAEALAAIDREIRRSAEAVDRNTLTGEETVAVKARAVDAEGFSLLAPSVPLTFETLKTAYRQAAKRYHPDVGGDTVRMQRVNDAYATFHSLLQAQAGIESMIGIAAGVLAPTADQIMRRARVREFTAHLDDLAVDHAFQAYALVRAQDLAVTLNWGVEEVCRLATLLAASSRNDDAHVVLGMAKALSDMAAERGLRFENLIDRAGEILTDSTKLRLILNHPRQAENALRLHLINEKRYTSALERIGATSEVVMRERENFIASAADRHYVCLPMDPREQGLRATGFVPNPDYYSRIDTLMPQQRNEYWRAFFGGEKDLIHKYVFIRATALIQAVIAGFEIAPALDEALTFAAATPERGSLGFYIHGLVTVLEFFQTLPVGARRERFKLLQSLDADPREGISITISVGGAGDAIGPPVWVQKKPILLTPAYLNFVQQPVEVMQRYVETGRTETAEAYAARIEENSEALAFQQSPLYQRALHDAVAGKAEDTVVSVSALLEEMYCRLDRPGAKWLEIGHWTDRLTIDLVKLKRYREALTWIERFANLPEPAGRAAISSQLDAIEKRRIRCETVLSK